MNMTSMKNTLVRSFNIDVALTLLTVQSIEYKKLFQSKIIWEERLE